jgi:hypothetical protein
MAVYELRKTFKTSANTGVFVRFKAFLAQN